MKTLDANCPKWSETLLPLQKSWHFPVDLAIELNVLIQERNLVHAKGQKLFSELRMGSKGVDKYRILTVLIVMGSKRAEEPAKMF